MNRERALQTFRKRSGRWMRITACVAVVGLSSVRCGFPALISGPVGSPESSGGTDVGENPASFFQAYPRDFLDYLVRRVKTTPNGAMGRNTEGYITVAFQRAALSFIVAGHVLKDPGLVRKGWQGIRYGFLQQKADGSFRSGLVDGRSLPEADLLSSGSFFLGAAGMSYRLIEQGPFRGTYSTELRSLKDRLRRGMDWLARNQGTLMDYDGRTANRLVFDALAFRLNGGILGDARLQEIGDRFLHRALGMQRKDGVFVEKGGADSSYQAVTLLMLQYVWIFTDRRPDSEVLAALADGFAWLKTRISTEGRISAEGNTRTGLGQEALLGHVKDINYPEVIQALFLWSRVSGEAAAREKAEKVLTYLRGASGGGAGDLKAKREEVLRLSRRPGISGERIQSARRLYKEAERAYKEGRAEEAARLLEEAIAVLSP